MSIVKATQNQIVSSKSVSGGVGKALTATGGIGLGLWLVAGLIPFITLPMLLGTMLVVGIFMWE